MIVGDEQAESLAGASKYCQVRWTYPSPRANTRGFVDAVKAKCLEEQVQVLLPMTDHTFETLLPFRDDLAEATLPAGDAKAFHSLTDKGELERLASSLSIRTPRTVEIHNQDEIASRCAGWEFPLVVKPALPHTRQHGWSVPKVRYVFNPEALRQAAEEYLAIHVGAVLVQEYVEGQGVGVFMLFRQGTPLACFAHRRLREKPPSGGVSVLCESIPVDPELRRMTEQLVQAVGWHGVAMTEWKCSPSKPPCLIEVNARFWGSLQLAVDAGMDFPWLLYQLALGRTPNIPDTYRIGVKSRWLLGDLDQLYMRLCKPGDLLRSTWRSRAKACIEFCKFSDPDLFYDVNRSDDMGPFWHELRLYLGALAA